MGEIVENGLIDVVIPNLVTEDQNSSLVVVPKEKEIYGTLCDMSLLGVS